MTFSELFTENVPSTHLNCDAYEISSLYAQNEEKKGTVYMLVGSCVHLDRILNCVWLCFVVYSSPGHQQASVHARLRNDLHLDSPEPQSSERQLQTTDPHPTLAQAAPRVRRTHTHTHTLHMD